MYILLLLRYMYAYIYILPDNVEEMCRVFLLQSKKVEVAAILLPLRGVLEISAYERH